MRRPARLSLLAMLAALACDAGAGASGATSVDTLATGTIVVRNAMAGGARRPDVWRLERVVRIGAADGEGPFLFGRVSDVLVGPDGLVYVLDGQACEVRVFDLAGRHVRTIGREGEGPGELRRPYALAFDARGRLWVADERARRYSLFGPDGTFLGTRVRPFRWPVTQGVLHFSRDGVLHEYGWWSGTEGGDVRLTADDSVIVRDTIPIPGSEPQLFARRAASGESLGMRVPFTPWRAAAVGPGGEVWVGHGADYRLAQLGPRGDTVRVVALDLPPVPLTDAERAAALDTAAQAERQGLAVDRARIPDVHPRFTSMVAAADGHLWVRRASLEAEGTPDGRRAAVYDVFTAEGRYVGSAPAPVGEHPTPHVDGRVLAGVVRDELDVPYVEVYRIVGPGG